MGLLKNKSECKYLLRDIIFSHLMRRAFSVLLIVVISNMEFPLLLIQEYTIAECGRILYLCEAFSSDPPDFGFDFVREISFEFC